MIWFMAPDLPVLSGGLRVLYAYAATLNAAGLPAQVWQGTPAGQHADVAAPTAVGLTQTLQPGDILVMPEVGGQKWQHLTATIPVVMLCQGTDFVFANTTFTTELEGPYPGWPNATAVLGVSETIMDFLAAACDPALPRFHVPVVIDTELFRPRAKRKAIALMPRRRREDLLAAVQLIKRSKALPDWELTLIDGMTGAQVAEALGEAALFLYGAEREGIGLPGAEALASGCDVVGFTGHGAKEYLLPEFSTVIPESDVVAMAAATVASARRFEAEPADFERRTAAGRQFIVDHYNADVMASALVAAFRTLTAAESPSLLTQAATVQHFQAFGNRPGLLWAAYRGARHWAGKALHLVRR